MRRWSQWWGGSKEDSQWWQTRKWNANTGKIIYLQTVWQRRPLDANKKSQTICKDYLCHVATVTKPFRQEKACNLTKVESTNRTNILSKKKKGTPWQGGNYGIGQICYIRVVLTPKKFTRKCVNREVVTYHKFVCLTFLIMFSCIHTSLDKTKQRGGVNN